MVLHPEGYSNDFKVNNVEDARRLLKEKQNYMLAIAFNQAREQGLRVTFCAVYFQLEFLDAKEKEAMRVPFVIAQIPGAKSDLERALDLGTGTIPFDATFFELRSSGKIRGTISNSNVEFKKTYDDAVPAALYSGICKNGIYEGTWQLLPGLAGEFRMVRDSKVL